MTKTAIKNKILDLQVQLNFLLNAVRERPDFDIDEKNWLELKKSSQKTKKKLYQKFYGNGKN